MALPESEYHRLADAFVNDLFTLLEGHDEQGTLNAELNAGVLTIEVPGGKTWVVSKHAVSRQLWLSSPVSGGLHFSYEAGQWQLADGRPLAVILSQELKHSVNIDVG
jgi:frataxin